MATRSGVPPAGLGRAPHERNQDVRGPRPGAGLGAANPPPRAPRGPRNCGGPLPGGVRLAKQELRLCAPPGGYACGGAKGAHLTRSEPRFPEPARAPSGGRGERERTACSPLPDPPPRRTRSRGRRWHRARCGAAPAGAGTNRLAALGSQGPESGEKGRTCAVRVTWPGRGADRVTEMPHTRPFLLRPVEGLGTQRGCVMVCWTPVF